MAFVLSAAIFLCGIVPTLAELPPQFVIVSFDGAGDAADLRAWLDAGDRVGARFTFFLSGVYLLAGDRSTRYHPPQHPAGASDIGFAIKPDDADVRTGIAELVAALNDADARDHEIATHFNGHFCGRRPGAVSWWSKRDWERELDEFDKLIRDVARNNDIEAAVRFRTVVGARTPCLEGDPRRVRAALRDRGFSYDASAAGYPGRWPWHDDVWVFPIPLIPVDGEPFATLATDFNFYLNQSGAEDAEPAEAAGFADQMYRSLVAYFDAQYRGARAPMSVAYHFEDWNHGAYRNALLRFLDETCRRPDVRCTTYRDVVGYLAQLP